MNRSADVIVVGGGIIGTATAIALCDLGFHVVLIGNHVALIFKEKDRTISKRLAGELLQPSALEALDILGLSDVIQATDSTDTLGYKVHSHSKIQTCPFSGKHQGLTFHHDEFLSQLRQRALMSNNISIVHGIVESVLEVDQIVTGVQVEAEHEKMTFKAPLTILSDGVFSRFREKFHPYPKKIMSQFVGLLLQNVPSSYSYYGHVIANTPSVALLYKIDANTYRILVDAPAKFEMSVSKYLQHFSTYLPKDLQASFEAALSQKPQIMPNTILNTGSIQQPGLLLIGDTWNTRHPFTGGGMTVGLWDVVHLKRLLAQKHSFIEDALILNRFHRAFCMNVLSQALYLVFAASKEQKARFYLKMGVIKYFDFGGDCVQVPLGILSGMVDSPIQLISHFLGVALCAIFIIMTQKPFYRALPLLILLLWDLMVTFLPIAYHDVKHAIGPFIKLYLGPTFIGEKSKFQRHARVNQLLYNSVN